MTELVIDVFEAVNISHDYGDRAIGSRRKFYVQWPVEPSDCHICRRSQASL